MDKVWKNKRTIGENGEENTEDVPEEEAAMNKIIGKAAKVNGVFASDCKTLGTPLTGVWEHMAVTLPVGMVNTSRVKNASQIMAEKLEDYRTLINAIQEYPVEIVEQAVALLQTDTMYRSDRVLGVAEWFKKLYDKIEGTNSTQRNNLIWYMVGTAPSGFCHIKSSMIGTLLDDIKEGYSTRVIMVRFSEKMNPTNYMRTSSAPTANAIEQAEKLVAQLGIEDSLRRRYATFEEIIPKCFWLPVVKKVVEKTTGGIFSNVTPKEKLEVATPIIDMPMTTMTWDKFIKTIIPTAEKIEAMLDNPNRFMALVTEAVEGSEGILNWDNPFSWYYHGGIDGEIKRRVEAAGGRYEDNEIRCSLIWENYPDLDVHCMTPRGKHIYYGEKRDNTGGWLDVDANGGGANTSSPVENIRWASHAPNGHYKFSVHNYQDRNRGNNPYKVELEVGGQIYTYSGFMTGTNDKKTVFEFDYQDGKVTNMKTADNVTTTNSEAWNVIMKTFVEVKGIVNSPNTWNGQTNPVNGCHTFFILKDCKDVSEGKGRGFFNEILKPELREIRKTLEVYSANTPIEGVDMADACGIGFTKDNDWNLILRVTSGKNTRLIKIDRLD